MTVKIELNISKLWAILLKDAAQYAYYSEKNRPNSQLSQGKIKISTQRY